MGQQLIIKEVYLAGVRKDDLKMKAEELDEAIRSCGERLMMLAASTPRKVEDIEGNPMDWIEHCQFEVNAILGDLKDAVVERHLVECAVSAPDMVEESC